MSIKSDRWIRRMAREHGMIEPFVERQVRQTDAQGRRVISYGVSSYGYDMRVAPEFKIFTNVLSADGGPQGVRRAELRGVRGRRLHRAAQQLRAGPLGGVLPDPAQRADDLRREEHLRPLRHHHQRHAVRARVGRARHARDQQHHAPARQDLRQRGDLPGAVLRGGRRTTSARPATPTRPGSTRGSAGSPCPGSRPNPQAHSAG